MLTAPPPTPAAPGAEHRLSLSSVSAERPPRASGREASAVAERQVQALQRGQAADAVRERAEAEAPVQVQALEQREGADALRERFQLIAGAEVQGARRCEPADPLR